MTKRAKEELIRQNICMFFIFLVVTLPICSSEAYSTATIHEVTSSGERGIPGLRAMDDLTRVNVSITFPGKSEIKNANLKLLQDSSGIFQCSLSEGSIDTFLCILEYPKNLCNPHLCHSLYKLLRMMELPHLLHAQDR
jgi:hypothetical protein